MQPDELQKKSQTKRTILTLSIVTVLMFGFAFAMVPLYRLVCDVTGLNSISTNGGRAVASVYQEAATDENQRKVLVQFDATINGNSNWEFRPSVSQMEVVVGKKTTTSYFIQNNSDTDVVTQSIPGVTPWQANEHLKKIECFCFESQTVLAGEAKDMGLQFVIDPNLPEDIKTVTLSYTIMDTNRTEMLNPNKDGLPSLNAPTHEHHDHAHHSPTKS